MREPKRLLAHGATDFERQLLKSVMDERPSSLLRSRMQRGLGLVGPLAWASNVKAMFSTITTKATVSVAVGGIVAAGGIAAVGLVPGSDSQQDLRDFTTSESRPVESVRRELPALVTPRLPEPAAELPVQNVETLPQIAENSQLREEIALLDQARAALQQGARKRALEALDEYRTQFSAGILNREANLLRRQAVSKRLGGRFRKTEATGTTRGGH